MKRCNACKELKFVEEFGKNSGTKDGLMRQCKLCNTNRVKAWHAQNSDEVNSKRRRMQYSRHHISEETYLKDISGGCMICGSLESLHIDHDHNCCSGTYSCGKCYRGMLCAKCNRALGGFKDDVDRLRKAVLYLESSRPD